MPHCLLEEVDGLVAQDQDSRSNVIRQATMMYVQQRKREKIREWLQQGYVEMAPLNLRLAAEAFPAETEADVIARRLVSGG